MKLSFHIPAMEPKCEKVTDFIWSPDVTDLVVVKPAVVETSLKRTLVIFGDEGVIRDEAATKDGGKDASDTYLIEVRDWGQSSLE